MVIIFNSYQQDYPESLQKLQQDYWQPIIKWVENLIKHDIKTTESILSVQQNPQVIECFREIVENYDNFKLSAFENAVLRSKSFMIGLALVEREISSEFGTMAARLEVHHQIQRWGEVEDSHDVDREDIHRQLASSRVALIQ